MRVADLDWARLSQLLEVEDRAVLPLGSTEQHATLSLATDSILAERMAVEAADPLGVPVFPVVPYGVTPYFTAYPGTVSLRIETYLALVGDLLDNLARMGCRRILLLNGHGGNAPAADFAVEWMSRNPEVRVKTHHWWKGPRTMESQKAIDPVGSHASWSESFPWTRVEGVETPEGPAPTIDRGRMSVMTPSEVRAYLGVGNMGGLHRRPDDEVLELWRVGVEETRAQIDGPWC
jgi:creatinine amidohydrolase